MTVTFLQRGREPKKQRPDQMTTAKSPVTADQVKAALLAVRAVADCIKELGSVPSGHLYAQLAPVMSLDTYQGVLRTLKNAELVEERSHELFWVGPN